MGEGLGIGVIYKAYLEYYGDMLDYIRKKIIAATDNPLKDDIFIMIYE